MINLESVSGLPIELGEDKKIKFNPPLAAVEPGIRTLDQMSKVLMDANSSSDRQEMYYMYRKVGLPEDLAVMDQHNIRYDITVIPPAKLGHELNKTLGHYHAHAVNSQLAYPEVYQVLHGRCLFLIQKMDPEFKKLIEVMYLEAKPGDKVIYPPNYGHIIVNLGNEPVVTANWVADHFESNYKDIEDRHGMAYYVTGAGDGKYNLIPNPHYQNIPAARAIFPGNMKGFHIYKPGPMYVMGINHPADLEFLTHPDKYAVELSSVTS